MIVVIAQMRGIVMIDSVNLGNTHVEMACAYPKAGHVTGMMIVVI